MSMSNFDPDDLQNSGMTIPRGTSKQDAARMIADEIIDKTQGYIKEVSTYPDTPLALRQYASTIREKTGSNTTGHNQHITLYFTEDPELPNAGRLLRLCVMNGYIKWRVLDTYHVNHNEDASGIWLDQLNTQANYANLGDGILTYPNNVGEDTDYSGGLKTAVTLYFWAMPNWICIRARASVNGRNLGHGHIFTQEPPDSGVISREDSPFIFAVDYWHDSGWENVKESSWIDRLMKIGMPGEHGGEGPGWNKARAMPELGIHPTFPDREGREIFQKLHLNLRRNQISAWFGHIPGLRAIRSSDNVSLYGVKSAQGRRWVVTEKAFNRCFLTENKTNRDY